MSSIIRKIPPKHTKHFSSVFIPLHEAVQPVKVKQKIPPLHMNYELRVNRHISSSSSKNPDYRQLKSLPNFSWQPAEKTPKIKESRRMQAGQFSITNVASSRQQPTQRLVVRTPAARHLADENSTLSNSCNEQIIIQSTLATVKSITLCS